MPDITLHDIDEKTWSAIRDAAESEDLSLNQVIKRALRAAARDDALRASVVREGPSVAYGDPPNLLLSIDPDLLARVRTLAVDRGTSVLDLVRSYFASLVDGGAKAPPSLARRLEGPRPHRAGLRRAAARCRGGVRIILIAAVGAA